MSVYDDLAARIRGAARHHARVESPPPMRFKVARTSPLTLHHLGAVDLVLEEGDPDVEIARDVLESRPSVGDIVIVHADQFHDYIVSGVVQ